MAYTISLGNKTYKTLNEEYTVTEERQKVGNTIQTKFSIIAAATNHEKTTDWINYPVSDPVGLIKKAMPSIVDNLPLIELNDRDRSLACSTCLLKGGKKIKLYLPITTTAKQLANLFARHDRIQLSDGEHVYDIDYKSIEALIIAWFNIENDKNSIIFNMVSINFRLLTKQEYEPKRNPIKYYWQFNSKCC